MSEYWDIYVLVPGRSMQMVSEFVERFLPDRIPDADRYDVPCSSGTKGRSFTVAVDLMRYLEQAPQTPHAIYWRSLSSGNPRRAMVFYTNDGNMILGLSVDEDGDEVTTQSLLRDFAASNISYILCEEPPPLNTDEFTAAYRQRVGE